MDAIRVAVTGARQVELKFEDALGDGLYQALKQEIEAIGPDLLTAVQAETPSRTGRLRDQERLRIFADPDSISAYIDIAGGKGSQDFAKAAALEYGAHRPTKVSAHSTHLDHHWAQKLAAPEMVLVAAYTRTPNIEALSFERGPLAAMAPQIVARLNAVVDKVAAEANR